MPANRAEDHNSCLSDQNLSRIEKKKILDMEIEREFKEQILSRLRLIRAKKTKMGKQGNGKKTGKKNRWV